MTSFVIGIDKNNIPEDEKVRDYVAEQFRKKGHDVETVGVGPGFMQSKGLSSSSSGKIGIMLVNGACLGTYKDFWQGITRGYYHYKYFYFGLQGWISPTTCSCKGAKTAKLKKAHDDHSSAGFTSDIVGMTTAEVMKKYHEAINYACGDTKEELCKNLLKVVTGQDMDDEGEGENTASTIKEALKELLSFWDGEVECRVENENVYVRKIPDPEGNDKEGNPYCNLELKEGINIISNSVNITDFNPDTVNYLTVKWKGEDIVRKDERLIARFGEKKKEMEAVKRITTTKTEETTDSDDNEEDTTTTESSTSTTTETTTEEVPVDTYEEALNFANTEWVKIKRDDGHTLECKVNGAYEWKPGYWAKVEIPSFDLDQYMYITRVSQDDSSSDGWTCNLSLSDYPPSLGEFNETETTDEDEDESDFEVEETEE